MRIHIIAIGGAVMHNLALELQSVGHQVTGSDDEIYDPARSRLQKAGLLPEKMGWDAHRITDDIELIILGMHAKADNPELLRSIELGLVIESFPEFVGNHAKDKRQLVVTGSHGKTTTTSIIMHYLKSQNQAMDFLVGAQLQNFDHMVGLSDAPYMIIEGDEYLSSAIDRKPKFLHYRADVLIITGIAWDHMNVFPSEAIYIDQFRQLLQRQAADSVVIFDTTDAKLVDLMNETAWPFKRIGYEGFFYHWKDGQNFVDWNTHTYPVALSGQHNMKNMQAAFLALNELALIDEVKFFQEMESFTGPAKRMDVLYDSDSLVVLRDFAHAPSKLKATITGVREKYPDAELIACYELHTYSSLNKDFLPQYAHSMDAADQAIVFFSPHTLEIKRLEALDTEAIRAGFDRTDLQVFTDRTELNDALLAMRGEKQQVYLMMSSGVFGGLPLESLWIETRL